MVNFKTTFRSNIAALSYPYTNNQTSWYYRVFYVTVGDLAGLCNSSKIFEHGNG